MPPAEAAADAVEARRRFHVTGAEANLGSRVLALLRRTRAWSQGRPPPTTW